MINNEDYWSQRKRFERIVEESFSRAETRFDDESPNLKFVLRDKGTGLLLTDIINWQPVEAARMTDAEIIAHLKAMGGDKL